MKTFCIALILSVAALAADYGFDGGVFTAPEPGDLRLTYYSPASKYGQVTDFGAEINGEPRSLDTHPTGNGTVVIEGVKAGDRIRLYMDSRKGLGTAWSDMAGMFRYEEAGGYYTFGDAKWTGGQVVAFKAGYDTAGQPLPGVLATVMSAAACLGMCAWLGTRRARA